MKDLHDAINEAQHVLDAREGNEETQVRLMNLDLVQRFNGVKEAMQNGETVTLPDLRGEARDIDELYFAIAKHLDRVSDLLDTLPGSMDVLEQRRDQLKSDLEKLHTELEATKTTNLAEKQPTIKITRWFSSVCSRSLRSISTSSIGKMRS